MWYEIFGRVCVHRLAILCVLQKQIFGTQTKYVFMRGISFYDSESHWQMVMFFPECVMKILLFAQHDCVKQIVQHLFLWYQIQNLNSNLIYVLHCIYRTLLCSWWFCSSFQSLSLNYRDVVLNRCDLLVSCKCTRIEKSCTLFIIVIHLHSLVFRYSFVLFYVQL